MTTSELETARRERALGSRRGLGYAAIALACGALLALSLHHPAPRGGGRRPTVEPSAEPSVRGVVAERRPQRAVSVPSSPPVIDRIEIEKSVVCEGEENLVTVTAHLPERPETHFRVAVGNDDGRRVPLRRWLDASGEAPPVEVSAWGPDGAMTTLPLPQYRVERCPPRPWLEIEAVRVPNETFVFELSARLRVPVKENEETKSPRVETFSWDFGDGEKGGGGPFVEHDFEPAERAFDDFERLIQVTAMLPGGEKVLGRQLLVLPVPQFDNDGQVRLIAKLTPRFPTLNERGVVEQGVRLFHLESRPVLIERVLESREYAVDGPLDENADSPGESPENDVNLTEILPEPTIPPGRGVELQLRFDARAEPDTAFIRYSFHGRSEDGRPVHGEVAVMRPPRPPTPSEHIPVEDRALIERIERAQKLLGRPTVTETELRRLEAEGAFEDLPPRAKTKML